MKSPENFSTWSRGIEQALLIQSVHDVLDPIVARTNGTSCDPNQPWELLSPAAALPELPPNPQEEDHSLPAKGSHYTDMSF